MAALDQGRPSRPALSGQTPERRPVGKVRDLQREADELHERFTAARDKGDLDTAKRLQTQGRELDELLTLHRDVKRAQQERDLVADAFDRAKSSGDMETARDLQARGRGLDEQLTIGRSELDRRVRSRVGAAIDQHGVQGVLDAIDSERTGWDTAKDIGKSVLAGTVGMGASALDSAETEFRADRQRGLMQEREAWNAQPDSPEKKQRLTELADIEKRMLAGDYSVSDVFRPPRPRTGKGTTVEEALSGAPIGPGVTADPLGTASTMNDSSDSSFYGLIRGIVNDKNENGQRMLRWQERIAKSRTAAAQEKAAQPWVNEHAQWDQPSTWFDGTKLADPESFAIGMAEIAPSIVPAIGASWVGGRMSALAVARNLRRTGKLDRMGMNAARKRIAAAGAAGGTVAGSGSEYVLMRDAATSQTRQALEAQHGKEEFWDGNAQFQKLLGEGHSREFAKQYLTNRYATLAGDVTGVVGAVLGAPMSRFLGKMGLENAVGRTAGAAKAGVGEALQESLQSTGEQLVQNIAQKNVDPTQPYTKGLLNAFVGGLFGGAGLGAVTGALGGGGDRGEEMLSPEGKRLIEAGFGDWMKLGNERVKLQNRMNDPKYEAKVTPEQRKSDLDQAERLEYEQAEAWLRAEPEIRRQQAKNKDTTAVEIKTTEEYGRQARKSMAAITQRRIDRKAADSELAAEHARTKETEEKAAATSADEQELAAKRQRVADVDTITNGGALEGENVAERYQALIDKGIGRWANATKTEFMITQKGARLSTEERSEVKNLEERLAGNYTGPERRQNRKLRERVAAMSDEELEKFVNQNPVSGMRNRRSYEDTESEEGPARAYASVDVDSLKWVNDNMGGHEKGDELLRTVARAFRNSGLDAYHVGGDEIVVRGETEEAIEAGMQRVAATLRKARPIEGISGQTIQPTVTWATGTDFKSADTKMGETKKTREAEGKRAKRGEPPPSLAEEGQIPPPPPLASDESAEEAGEDYDPDDDKAIDLGVVAERLFGALTLARTEKQTARQRRRVRELEGKYWNLQTLMEETRAEQGLDEGTPISISPRAMRNFYQSARAR
jgi:GGDEF domain-containing protein